MSNVGDKIMDKTKVSIIVPVYNVENYLERCLDSLVNQTLSEVEIICIDDGSTDASAEILEQYEKEFHNIVVIKQKNKGVSIARNNGINIAHGEYIAFVDSDDYVEEDMCEEAYQLAKKHSADIVVYGGEVFSEDDISNDYLNEAFQFFKDNLDVQDEIYVNDSIKALTQSRGSWPLIWNKLYKRELVIESGCFTHELALGEDEAFLFAIFPLAERIVYTNQKFYHYLRNRPESATDRLVMDFEGKAVSNLKMAEIVRDTWKAYGILEDYETEFLDRYVGLLFADANSLAFAPETQKEHMKKVLSFFNEFPSFGKKMLDAWYEKGGLYGELAHCKEQLDLKQNEIWGLMNSRNVLEGQVSVLKEVMADKKIRRIKPAFTGKYRNTVTKFKNKFKSAYLENIDNIFSLIEKNGFNTYERLKQAYGSDCVFFTCAFAGIGDAFLVGSYINTWLEKNQIKNYRFLLGGISEKKMIEALFPQLENKCVLITQQEHEWLRNLNRICGQKTDFYFFHHYDYMQPHLQLTHDLQGYKNLNMKDLYLYQMGLSAKEEYVAPVQENKYEKEVTKLFKENKLEPGKTVLIAPYSTCLGKLSEGFWRPIITELKKKGYAVCCNCNKNEKPLTGTIGLFIEFKYLLPFVERAGSFIGFRSGLCDVVSACDCNMAVIHPYESVQWKDGNGLAYVGIQNMGLRENILEVELKKGNSNLKEVQNNIIKYIVQNKES